MLEASDGDLRRVLDTIQVAVVATGADGRVLLWNPMAERMYAVSAEVAVGAREDEVIDLVTVEIGGDDGTLAPTTRLQVDSALRGRGSWSGRLTVRSADGRLLVVDAQATQWHHADGSADGTVWVMRDVTDEDHLRHQRDAQHQLAQTVLDVAPTMALVLDRGMRIVMANASWLRGVTELGDVPMIGDDFPRLTLGSALLVHGSREMTLRDQVEQVLASDIAAAEVDVEVIDAQGAVRCYSVQVIRLPPGPDADSPAVVLVMTDVSVRRSHERSLAHQANHDPLTGLPNRALIEEELGRALGRASRSGRRLAVLFCDLDRFKPVNDEAGHLAGDVVLREVADRLVHACRVSDVVARFGGDEFVIVAEDVSDAADLLPLTDRIIAGLRHPIRAAGSELRVGVSIGIAVSDGSGGSAADLIARADLAMYAAKQAGGDRVEVFTPSLREELRSRIPDGDIIRRALDADEMQVVFQPVVGRGPSLVAIECLVRWAHPAYGLLGPTAILTMPGAGGSLADADSWVLRQALARAAEWLPLLGDSAYLSVNVSGRLLADPQWADWVLAGLAENGVEPRRLGVEFTQDALAYDPLTVEMTLGRLRQAGVQVILDDFGGGRGTLVQFDSLPLTAVKLDSCLTDRLEVRPGATRLLGAAVAFCHAYGLPAIAKAVGSPAMRSLVEQAGCDASQGFALARPAPPGDMTEWLEAACRDPEWLATP